MIKSGSNQSTKTVSRNSNRSNDVQRSDGWCEFGTYGSGEWACELRPKSRQTGRSVGGDGDSTVIWELDIQTSIIGCVFGRVELADVTLGVSRKVFLGQIKRGGTAGADWQSPLVPSVLV